MENCSRSFTGTLSLSCEHPAGTEFELAQHIQIALVAGPGADGGLNAGLELGPLPPGAFMVRCDGDTSVQVVRVGPEPDAGLRIASLWPNPGRGEFRASVFVPARAPTIVRLMDIAGRTVESFVWDASRGSSRELKFGPALEPGFYFIHVSQGARSVVRSVAIR